MRALRQPYTDTFSFHTHCSCVSQGWRFGKRPGSGRARKTRRLPLDKSNIYTGLETDVLCTSCSRLGVSLEDQLPPSAASSACKAQSETRAPEKTCVPTAKRKHQGPQHCRCDPAGDEVAAGNVGYRSGRGGAWPEACWGSECQEDPAWASRVDGASGPKCLHCCRLETFQGSWENRGPGVGHPTKQARSVAAASGRVCLLGKQQN